MRQITRFLPIMLLTWITLGAASNAGADWNRAVDWRGYAQGMKEVAATGKPGVLVFFTDWCPHCTTYAHVFHDPRVVALARQFVMIRVNRDEESEVNDRYAKAGTYVPRTLFLGPDGAVDWSARGANDEYPHFLATDDPEPLLRLMQRMVRAQKS